MDRLVIIDYYLAAEGGHHEVYDYSIAREAVRRGKKVEVLSPSRQSGEKPAFLEECLDRRTRLRRLAEKMPFGISYVLKTALHTAEMRTIFRTRKFDEKTVVLFQTVDRLFPLSFCLATAFMKPRARVVVILRRGIRDHYESDSPFIARLKSAVHDPFMRLIHRWKNVVFCSDSNIITDELHRDGFDDAVTFPIPHLPPRQPLKKKGRKTIVGFWGGARFEKGFDLLPDIIEDVIKRSPKHVFKVHNYAHGVKYLHQSSSVVQVAQERMQTLKKKHPKNILIISRYLSDADYAKEMGSCDIVLIPYRRELYGGGTSGILAEGIAFGEWIVVPDKTWMSDQARRYGKISIFRKFDAASIADAVLRCTNGVQSASGKRLNAQISEWYYFHSQRRYVTLLESLSAGI